MEDLKKLKKFYYLLKKYSKIFYSIFRGYNYILYKEDEIPIV
jgi:hypothetical protein